MSKNYTKEQLLKAVNSGFDSLKAATKHPVPASTIRRHRRNPLLKARIGRPSYLTNDEEMYFVSLLKLLPDYGFRASREVVLQLANDYCKSLGLSHQPGEKWLRLFMIKYTNDIKWKREQKMERARAEAFTEEVRVGWFGVVKDVMMKYDLFDKPHQVFNIDESGFSDKTKGELVIVNANRRHIFESEGGSGKTFFTVLIAINAGGLLLPPFVIYSGQNLVDSWCHGGPPQTTYTVTDKIMKNYFKEGNKSLRKADFPRLLKKLFVDKNAFSASRIVSSFTRSGIWPFDEHAMKEKVVRKYNTSSNATSNDDENKIPSNFLISPPRSINSTSCNSFPLSSSNSFPLSSSNSFPSTTSTSSNSFPSTCSNCCIKQQQQQQSPTTSQSVLVSLTNNSTFVSSNNNPSFVTSNQSVTYNSPAPVNQTIVDGNIVLPSDITSYIDLQQHSFSLISQIPSSTPPQQTTLIDEEEKDKNGRDSMNTSLDDNVSSTPIVAVRDVINNLLSQRDAKLSMSQSSSNRSRGKRLQNKIGLNITDSEYVLSTLTQKEEKQKQIRTRKPRVAKDKTKKSRKTATTKKTTTSTATETTSTNTNKENGLKDPHIAAAIQRLESVIEFTQSTIDNDTLDLEL
ncbi:unnamed protein product [Adineta steineri]|uniref:HTH CENPB-type domain-containing protein n=1 Tax=Adineta steineri TaxID=433720 RepID=A0A816FZH3_9BILA|nr:unnamed protein product [Adineta steineri]CAF1668196.1 unnamed protein product [Adineta steineri]